MKKINYRQYMEYKNKTMKQQLKHLQNEIDSITLDNIKDNSDPRTIKGMFKTISENIEAISEGKKPYGLDSLDSISQCLPPWDINGNYPLKKY
tara:strand:+ start:705 stop:983 length:279 start_codon:yes stop_codon:yes gene_type:complete